MTTSPVPSITDELLAELDALLGLNASGSLSQPLPYLSRVLLEKSVEHIRSLAERMENAEKDAGRYQWMRARALRFRNDARKILGNQPPMKVCEFDSETDAAIAQEGQSHE